MKHSPSVRLRYRRTLLLQIFQGERVILDGKWKKKGEVEDRIKEILRLCSDVTAYFSPYLKSQRKKRKMRWYYYIVLTL